MKKNTQQKSNSKKLVKGSALLKDVRKMKLMVKTSFFVFFGMILGIVITGVIVGRKIESMSNKLPERIALNANKNSSPKYPAVAKISFPAAILSVGGTVETVSKSEIKIKSSACQGEKKYTGKIIAMTEIIKRERKEGSSSFPEEIVANISEIKKNDQVTLESLEDISKGPVFEVRRIIIEKPFAAL